MTQHKTCKRCRKDKPLTDYYNHPNTKDKLFAKCKPCHYEECQQRHKVNPEPHKQALKRYYRKNRQTFIEKATAYYERNKAKVLARAKERYQANNFLPHS